MNVRLVPEIRTINPLSVSVGLFLLISLCYLIFGVLTPIFDRRFGVGLVERFGFVFSPRSDEVAFGKTTIEVIREQPVAVAIYTVVYYMLAGFYMAVFILHTTLIWFGLRQGQPWALWSLIIADLTIPIYFFLAVQYFSKNVAPLTLGDLPPYILLPLAILPFAAGFGLFGI